MNCYSFLNWRSQFWDQPLSILCVHPEGHDFGLDPTWRWTEWQRYLSRSSSSWHGAPGTDSPRLFWSGSVMNESTKYRSTSSAALQKCIWSPSIFNLTVLVLRISWNHSFLKSSLPRSNLPKKHFFGEKVFAANWFCPPCADCVKSYQTPVWEQKVRFIQGLADEQEQPDMNVLCSSNPKFKLIELWRILRKNEGQGMNFWDLPYL